MNRFSRRNLIAGAGLGIPMMFVGGGKSRGDQNDLPMIVLAPPGGATHLPLIIKAKEFDKQTGVNVQIKPRNELAAYFNDFAAKVEPIHQGGAASVFGNMRVRGVPIVLTQSTC